MKQQRYHYITLMKMKRETYILLILISLISLNPLCANNWNIGAFGGAYLFIPGPIQEDVIDPRISASASLIYSPLIFNITHDVQMALQLQLTHTTKSQYYGPIYWKEFTTIGTGLEITLGTLKPLSFSLAFIYALQFKDDERGWFDLGIIRTTFIIPFSLKEERATFALFFPIEVEVRGDYSGLRMGAGLRLNNMRYKR